MSLKAAKAAYQFGTPLALLTQKQSATEDPKEKDLYQIGTLARIKRFITMPDGTLNLAVEGIRRIRVKKLNTFGDYYTAFIEPYDLAENGGDEAELMALAAVVSEKFRQQTIDYSKLPKESLMIVNQHENLGKLIAVIIGNLDIKTSDKQELLECRDERAMLTKLLEILNEEGARIAAENKIKDRVKSQMEKNQRDYYLNEQLKAIQKELTGVENEEEDELQQYAKKIAESKMSKEARAKANQELKKLKAAGPMSAESTIIRNYLDWLVDLPWGKYSPISHNLGKAIEILDEDHYGLQKVKERIIEYLAVQARSKDLKSPILCLVGAPGVGKTSLGRSIARATGRKFVRASLGGMRDEAEIRGHRRTYIGAMPGRIVKNILKAGSSNPVFILDEIDKVSANNHQGDPASALLEVLDPEQNNTFHDNYLDVDYDLSKVLFIATANDISSIPRPLLDRMELIEVGGYITEEKIEIAKRHLIPKELENTGLDKFTPKVSFNKAAIEGIIEHYTRESGVRQLKKQINKGLRKMAYKLAYSKELEKPSITASDLKEILGTAPFTRDIYQGNDYAGVVTGLAWTSVGGEILFIETSLSKGRQGKLTLTGNLGDVMKESAIIALEYIKAHIDLLGVDYRIFENWNIHIHVPEGATPKDGPSAGITIATSIASAITQRKVRKNIAMTGEITLRGKVLPVGGIKEKILAAKRAGITDIVICKENKKNILDIPEKYLKGVEFHYVEDVADVWEFALTDEKVKHPIDFTIPENDKKEKK